MRLPAVRLRNEVFTGSCHADAMAAMFSAFCKTDADIAFLSEAIDTDEEPIEFGRANPNGSDFASIFPPGKDDVRKGWYVAR